jgi:N-acetylmuramic acid 6-phosphate etherase
MRSRVNSQMSSRREDRRRTEQRLAASKNLDRMTAAEIVWLMNREDRKVAEAVGRELPAIARAVDAIVGAMRNGGRLIYVGAGSSGRMAVLDAAECPPTFGISKKQMIALIAGGRRAVTGAVEGAEDSAANGARDLRRLELGRKDVVVGIAASGGGDGESGCAAGAVGEDCDRCGSGGGGFDRVDAVEGGDIAEDGLEHAEYGGDGEAGTCL